ncbi:hypothetical protein KCU99_g355, partial [Aureobasidium melanogenum]
MCDLPALSAPHVKSIVVFCCYMLILEANLLCLWCLPACTAHLYFALARKAVCSVVSVPKPQRVICGISASDESLTSVQELRLRRQDHPQ